MTPRAGDRAQIMTPRAHSSRTFWRTWRRPGDGRLPGGQEDQGRPRTRRGCLVKTDSSVIFGAQQDAQEDAQEAEA